MSTLTETISNTNGNSLQLVADTPKKELDITLNYLKPGGDEELFFVRTPKEGERANNIETIPFAVKVTDARGHEADYALDKNGFTFIKHRTSEENIQNLRQKNDKLIEQHYYPEVEAVLKENTGADRVFIFDHTVRKRSSIPDTGIKQQTIGVADRVHIDQTPEAGVNRVRHHLPEEADKLLKGRVQIINFWRPLIDGIEDWPLALADYRSIAQEDLVRTKLIYPDRVGYTYSVHHNPSHKWHFLSKMAKDDVILIKCFDSKTDRARLTPHTAFSNPEAPKSAPPRESVEIRALVFHTQDRN